jgi:hypothetical protein
MWLVAHVAGGTWAHGHMVTWSHGTASISVHQCSAGYLSESVSQRMTNVVLMDKRVELHVSLLIVRLQPLT